MRWCSIGLALVWGMLVAGGLAAEEEASTDTATAGPVTYQGTFTWNGLKKPFALSLELQPAEDGFAAEYVARWNDKKDHPYSGTFAPPEADGTLVGKASVRGSDDYVVRGRIDAGTFKAEFFKLKKGREVSDGTFTLKKQDEGG